MRRTYSIGIFGSVCYKSTARRIVSKVAEPVRRHDIAVRLRAQPFAEPSIRLIHDDSLSYTVER